MRFPTIELKPGESKQISVEIPVERFRYWDETQKQYIVEPGKYELLIGAASDDIRLRVPLRITGAK
ncbi:MAG: fibronectin type III-like domain-contianing protein [Limisphaerales bacterium]